MFDFEEANLDKLVVHRVGNKAQNEGVIISNELCDIYNDLTESMLKRYFLSPFDKVNNVYRFKTETADFSDNLVYNFVKKTFEDDEANFYFQSVDITNYLYEKSTHPNIKYGEVYVVYIKQANIDGEKCDAIGIFKSENKDVFIDVVEKSDQLNINWRRGTNIKKLDKGCIVFNTDAENGYKIVIIDNTNNKEAKYWENDFLSIDMVQDEFVKTKEIVDIAKNFVNDVYVDDKKEKAVILNNTYEYLKENEVFEQDHFVEHVLEKPQDKERFKSYIEEVSKEKMDVTEFPISQPAIKEVKKEIVKTTIKLDKNIEIKLTDINKENSEFIERGFDKDKQMYYYKFYFNDEK
jgi:hypothetical protein